MVKFSIIIPCKNDSPYLEECLKFINKMSFTDYEIIVIPDIKFKISGVKVIQLKSGPAQKRDLGAKFAHGEFLAFIDDDAYPEKDWLKNSLNYFKGKVVAVGGPQVTPPGDSLLQKASGFILSSRLVGGLRARYESVGKSFFVDDWPTVNFIVKRSVFLKVGGFDSHYYPGEDTKFSLDLINAGFKIIYAPDCVVYHHRRNSVKTHVKQISNYGLHRGLFVKKFPKTSFKLNFFIPSFFFLFVTLGLILSFFSVFVMNFYLLSLAFYFIVSFFASLRARSFKLIFLTSFGIFLTHFFYGAYFIKGLLTSEVVR